MVLDLVDDGLVLQDLTVVVEVDGLRLLREDLDLAAGIVIALLEGLKRSGSLATEAERGRDLGPVDLESGAALYWIGGLARASHRITCHIAQIERSKGDIRQPL